jgi:HEAT repeat protein
MTASPDHNVMRFQDLETFTAGDVEAAIMRNDPEELPLVPITVAMLSPGPAYAAEVCARLAGHDDPAVRGNAVVALGHLVRRFSSLDERQFKPIIETALLDSQEYVRNSAKSAADEMHQFLHWTIAGHIYG